MISIVPGHRLVCLRNFMESWRYALHDCTVSHFSPLVVHEINFLAHQ